MIWFWSRDSQEMRLETRYDNETSEFILVVHYADGRQQTERFAGSAAYRTRLHVLEQQFEAERWTPSGKPLIVPEGFPRRRLSPEVAGYTRTPDQGEGLARRMYRVGGRTFQVTLATSSQGVESSWRIVSAVETSRGEQELLIPKLLIIAAATQDAAFARACDCIDKWLISHA